MYGFYREEEKKKVIMLFFFCMFLVVVVVEELAHEGFHRLSVEDVVSLLLVVQSCRREIQRVP
jgi:hypothetical protein